ncbi:GOLPH3/VPS74 family protein [Amycolatopsis pittospori]|uniref:GOLPH3/VPS74 family protein n=1 Tax=Amycolatopsis pittospori TaxID=2749434 RepID=UPI0015F06C75|nr:GPP34 family phosphoprotein [Amycolatopsis pittospori]
MRRLTLVDSLFFLAHDEFTGKPALRRTGLGIGMAGSALCDLLLAERITVERKRIRPLSRRRIGHPVLDRAFSEILGEREWHTVREWVDHLRQDIGETVANNLLDAGVINRETDRGLMRKIHRYPPRDLLMSTAARSKARAAVLGTERPDPHSVCLALLAWTIGLDDLCEPELDRAALRDWAEATHRDLPRSLADLISGIDAVGAAVVYTGDRH